ncbi:MAG: hypothetical protein HY721_27525 [Planctomycetes bacterium]|nr:hypothetical protein [Planctomycetota bacterium]
MPVPFTKPARRAGALCCVAGAIALAGCGPAGDAPAGPPAIRTAPPAVPDVPAVPPPAPSQEPSGNIEGVVLLQGSAVPAATLVPVGTDPQHCGKERSLEDYVVDAASRGIRHVIVHLEGAGLERLPPAPPERLVLDNKDCRFEPHAAVLTAGSTLAMANGDPILHTVHAYFAASFNVALAPGEPPEERRLTRPGLVQLRCDSHGWMNAFIRVDRHPFHAVTDAQGRFAMTGIPPGRYTLKGWHERLGEREIPVEVKPGDRLRVDVKYDG